MQWMNRSEATLLLPALAAPDSITLFYPYLRLPLPPTHHSLAASHPAPPIHALSVVFRVQAPIRFGEEIVVVGHTLPWKSGTKVWDVTPLT